MMPWTIPHLAKHLTVIPIQTFRNSEFLNSISIWKYCLVSLPFLIIWDLNLNFFSSKLNVQNSTLWRLSYLTQCNMMYMYQICEHCGIVCLILLEENIKVTKKLPEYMLFQDISSWNEKKPAFDMALLL